MPAQIIQTNTAAFAPKKIDPVTLDIVENALRNARIEMDATLVRTAMSPGIREQGDAFPLIANPDGKMIVGQFGSFIDGFMRNFNGTIGQNSCSQIRRWRIRQIASQSCCRGSVAA